MKSSVPLVALLASLALTACGGGGESSNNAPASTTNAPPMKLLAATSVGNVTTFTGKRANYTIVVKGTAVTVTDNVGADGTVNLSSPSRLVFADAGVAFDLIGTAGKVYRLYQAAFNRTPDLEGLGFWIEQMDKGFPIHLVAEQFVSSAEFVSLYGAKPSNADVVNKFYQNVLHRKPDLGGFEYWSKILDTNAATVALVLASFGESAENQGQVAAAIANGISYTLYKATPPPTPGILTFAGMAACPNSDGSESKQFYSCMVGSAVGTTLFGTDRCVLNIGSDGVIIMATKDKTRMVQTPYFSVNYIKRISGSPDIYTITVGVSDISYMYGTAMSGRQGLLSVISPKHPAGGLLGVGIEAHLDDLHCKFPLQ